MRGVRWNNLLHSHNIASTEPSRDSFGISLVKLPQIIMLLFSGYKRWQHCYLLSTHFKWIRRGTEGIEGVVYSAFSEREKERISETCKIILMTAVSKAFQCLSMTQKKISLSPGF